VDPVRNPFAPGAGSPPPELAGREAIIEAADIALKRLLLGRHDKSQILLGLRGVGKTVLLNTFEERAIAAGHKASFVEAPEGEPLAALLYPKIHQALRQMSLAEGAKSAAHGALRALRSFASAFKVKVGDVSISVDPELGVADSGNLELDLADVFMRVGETARAAGSAWTLLIDEIQYLTAKELAALIVALHRVSQKNLPVMLFGAGLPQIAALAGEAKSYAERLFDFTAIGPLDRAAAISAIRRPIEEEEESIDDEALELIVTRTEGYPFFLQEWGYHTWNFADRSPFSRSDVDRASAKALERLDAGFFRVRFDRLTPKERDYVQAMAKLGKGPYRSGDVAAALGEAPQSLGPRRAAIIAKGMIYSPQHGDIDFTVPMFDEFLRRNFIAALRAEQKEDGR
jgi:hypothetical protein